MFRFSPSRLAGLASTTALLPDGAAPSPAPRPIRAGAGAAFARAVLPIAAATLALLAGLRPAAADPDAAWTPYGVAPPRRDALRAGAYRHDPQDARAGRSPLGGGFLELVMSGRDPERRTGVVFNDPGLVDYGHPARRHAAPLDPYADPLMDVSPLPSRRRAILPEPSLERPVLRAPDAIYDRQIVAYDGPHPAGTLVIDTPRRFLFLVQGDGRAVRYGIGVGRPGFEWAGAKRVTRKAEWPSWVPPAEMLKRRPDLPRFVAGGPDNPLGARALYLGSSLYRIHGTNEPHTIGGAVSSGCIRMRNEDVIDLYGRVSVGAKVIVI